jgi:predicted porin
MYNVGDQSPLGSADTLDSAAISADYKICPKYTLSAGYEWNQYDLKNRQHLLYGSGSPLEQYINVGLTHPFNKQADIRVGYEYVSYDDKKTYFDPYGNSSGSIITSQIDYKF